jgi:hypothetical protein
MLASTSSLAFGKTIKMRFEDLLQFISRDMRMSHVYQPVMLRELLRRGGRASRNDIARALLNEDRSQLDYYSEITRDMVGRVLQSRHIVKRDGANYEFLGYDELTPPQVEDLKRACSTKLDEYVHRQAGRFDLATPPTKHWVCQRNTPVRGSKSCKIPL